MLRISAARRPSERGAIQAGHEVLRGRLGLLVGLCRAPLFQPMLRGRRGLRRIPQRRLEVGLARALVTANATDAPKNQQTYQ